MKYITKGGVGVKQWPCGTPSGKYVGGRPEQTATTPRAGAVWRGPNLRSNQYLRCPGIKGAPQPGGQL